MNIKGQNIITVSSLAKGFGIPIAVLSGAKNMIQEFKEKSKTRLNNSPVSNAHLTAAQNALLKNKQRGERWRNQLLKRVIYLKRQLHEIGLVTGTSYFPVQIIRNLTKNQAIKLHNHLKVKGIETLLLAKHGRQKPALGILLNVNHKVGDIDYLIQEIYFFWRSTVPSIIK